MRLPINSPPMFAIETPDMTFTRDNMRSANLEREEE